ncbi:MAG: winged helix-turn-helix domain-containing protein, partial [Candidatus Hermodarchaeota archaeon]
KKALVYTQIYLTPEPITAKEIAQNTGLALNTVYNYIRELSEEDIIDSQTENVGNLIQERWFINSNYIKQRRNQIKGVINKEYEDYFLVEPKEFSRQLMLLKSMATPYIKTYEYAKEKFEKIQEHSSRPAIIKLWSLFPDEFEYVVKEIENIRKKLRQLNKVSREQQELPSNLMTLKGENNLVFVVALPNINEDEKS